MIQLTRKGVVFSGSNADLRDLRARFARDHYIILPRLIEPDLLETILRRIESAPFEREEFNGIVSQSLMKDPNTFDILLFLLNSPAIHRLVERITGCRRIADFRGRVYRMLAAKNDRITWHTDLSDHRLIAFSLNLTPQYFRGGVLQIKYRGSDEILHEVRNTGLGDALLLRVARRLHHRVLPVEGHVPRTAMSGWFRWEKQDFHNAIRTASSSAIISPARDADPAISSNYERTLT
jgi:hypothetical protein